MPGHVQVWPRQRMLRGRPSLRGWFCSLWGENSQAQSSTFWHKHLSLTLLYVLRGPALLLCKIFSVHVWLARAQTTILPPLDEQRGPCSPSFFAFISGTSWGLQTLLCHHIQNTGTQTWPYPAPPACEHILLQVLQETLQSRNPRFPAWSPRTLVVGHCFKQCLNSNFA